MFRPVKKILLAALCLTITACGFHLRGQATLPFETLYVNASNNPSFDTELKRALVAGTNAHLSDNPKDAEAIIQLVSETREKQILSLNTGGTVAEYELRLHVTFRLYGNNGKDWIPRTEIVLKRALSYSDTAVLAFNDEEEQSYKDMQTDVVQQIVQRMSRVIVPIS